MKKQLKENVVKWERVTATHIYRLFLSLFHACAFVSAYRSRRGMRIPLLLLRLLLLFFSLFVFCILAIFFCHCFALLQFFRTVWPKAFYCAPAVAVQSFHFHAICLGHQAAKSGGGGVLQERRPNGGNETMKIIITWQRAARRNHSLYLVPTVLTTRLSCALFLTHYLRTHTFSIYVCMCQWLACIATCETCEKATFSRSFLRRVAASIWRMQLVHLL